MSEGGELGCSTWVIALDPGYDFAILTPSISKQLQNTIRSGSIRFLMSVKLFEDVFTMAVFY